ncbi:uncharacterized protein LOC109728293 isoform X1 [Ananas comosus]|uniref:Uncharacterized protein LOC109728293 isoform X1 n=1 Tax=Ananas comosus TaxID=4615 RepID=A0A6P5HHL9_ANACO|nr:uncharacterized protein LOC109728293 isoform X1 [Ananas comosus]
MAEGKEMESPASCSAAAAAAEEEKGREGMPVPVDPFLVEALGNPRHRVTEVVALCIPIPTAVLRMEMDIQRFMKNPDLYQFEFPHFATSYLRRCAHRVAQHYGLQTMSLDNTTDGSGSRVMARKTLDSKFPAICLSEVSAQQPEKEIAEKIKIAIRPRPRSASSQNAAELYNKSGLRTVEERKEEYDKARARIFSGSNSPVEEGSSSPVLAEGRGLFTNRDEQECTKVTDDIEKFTKEGGSRVAIFKDREKDRSDPDYDRSYDRYVRGLMHNQSFSLGACTMVQPPLPQFDARISQFGHLPRNQTPMSYNLPHSAMNPYCAAFGQSESTSKDPVYFQWPNPAMIYANSYEQLRLAQLQAPFYQQLLSFGHPQNC